MGVIGSERIISEMITSKIGNPHTGAQKYHLLLLEGMAKNRDKFSVEAICMPEFSLDRRVNGMDEIHNGIKFTYLTYVKNKALKSFLNGFELLLLIFKWKRRSKLKEHYLMFDHLHFYSSLIALLWHKIFNIKLIVTVTDIPEFMFYNVEENSLLSWIRKSIGKLIFTEVDTVVALTQQTIESLNLLQKKTIVIEGLVDADQSVSISPIEAQHYKIIHYSGGIIEQYGVKALIDAFRRIENPFLRLHIFGNGDLQEYIESCMKSDFRIQFFGYQPNQVVMADQRKSFVLVNPRFTEKSYTEYSFPSKTIEYMASGVPLLTNRLAGIPGEYFDYVYSFKDQTVEGYKSTLEELILIPQDEMRRFGREAQSFVFVNKNNKLQALKLYEVLSN